MSLTSALSLIFVLAFAASPAFAKRPAATTHPAAASDEPLFEAAKKGDLDAVQAALKGGAQVNTVNTRLLTPLACAARAGALPVVQLLLDRGADPNLEADVVHSTPLQAAVSERHDDVAMLLIQHHADATAGAGTIYAPLAYAAENGDLPMVKVLVNLGAKPDTDTHCLGDSFDLAVNGDHVDVLAYFLSIGFRPSHRDPIGATPLHIAADAGATECVRYLAAHGADLNAIIEKKIGTPSDIVGLTPLDMVNKSKPHPETEKVLIELGAKHGPTYHAH